MFDRVKTYFKRNDLDADLQQKISHLEKILDSGIEHPDIFLKALRHRSIVAEESFKPEDSYERLEFLGDAVLDLIITEIIFEHYPRENEGFLTKLRSKLVKGEALARYARKLNLGSVLEVGERARGQGIEFSKSILADIFEALIGALYLDAGYKRTYDFVQTVLQNYVNMDEVINSLDNYKSILLEYTQANKLDIPVYEVKDEFGPGHDKTFEIRVLIDGQELGRGKGKSKKKAEQKAARNALIALNRIA